MVLKNQAPHSGASLPLKKQTRSQSADSAPDDDAVMRLSGVGNVLGKRIVNSIANRVSCLQNPQGVSVGCAVFADTAVASELIPISGRKTLRRNEFRRSGRSEQYCPRSQQSRPEEITAS